MKHTLLSILTACCMAGGVSAAPLDYSQCLVTGKLDRDDARYAAGEEMVFKFMLYEKEQLASGRLLVRRRGDDGKEVKEIMTVDAEHPAILKSSMDKPGFVMVTAQLLKDDDSVATRPWNGGTKNIEYGLGAGVEPEKIRQGAPEPADFDEFWARAKSELAAVPLEVVEKKLVKSTDTFDAYYVAVKSLGKRPVTGYLTIPKNAAPKSLPLHMYYHGYGMGQLTPVEKADGIHFTINAHGIELGREQAYYDELQSGELRGFGFNGKENENPDTCYFKLMILRDLRAVEYARTLPEWNGKETMVTGGSAGAFQTCAVTALMPGITSSSIVVPWLCDLGGVQVGRLRGWRPDFAKGISYYDTVNFASRIHSKMNIGENGLSDWVCPPSSIWVLYNNLKGPATMTTAQGRNHASYAGHGKWKIQKFTYSKNQ